MDLSKEEASMQMRLKCAVENMEEKIAMGHGLFAGAYEVLAAAKRELQRQEAERPKRATLAVIEDSLRYAAPHLELLGKPHAEKCAVEAADILKALRLKIVPALRRAAKDGSRFDDQGIDSLGAQWLLREIGED